ncbi:MAG TPA: CehA/McbA family metallohydrolase [Kofleriaceae bacterium]|nr:CehA/McbA family metallohydrolase [Kofleriaceae bacterium]
MTRAALFVLVACASTDPPHRTPVRATIDAGVATPAVATSPNDEVWLKGSTHVHARPSGDSTTPIEHVIAWYEQHGYDFIALTDHNRVTEVEPGASTAGQLAVRAPARGLIVLAGTELTHNPDGCEPVTHPTKHCRIHVNVLGATARPKDKLDWADRTSPARLAKYQSAIVAARALGGAGVLVQLNHPQWFWGMSTELLVELARRGVRLYELANAQFETWNAGDASHPSTEALWDAALGQGVTLWAVASDDAHDYEESGGRYPAGGGWVMVKARRDPQAIVDALAAGRFYASTGVTLDRVDVTGDELVVEAASDAGARSSAMTIQFIENGTLVATVQGPAARHPIPQRGYVRAVVTNGAGARAWTQPVWRR